MPALAVTAEADAPSRHSADVECLLWHGGRLYSGADDGRLKIWSKDLKLEKEIEAHKYALYDILITGELLLTASIDATVKVWSLASLELRQTLTLHQEAVRKLAAAGDKIYSGDEKGVIHRWKVAGGKVEPDTKYEVVEEVWDLKAKDDLFIHVRDRGVSVVRTVAESTCGADGLGSHAVVHTMQGRAPLYLSPSYLVFNQFGAKFGFNVHKYQPDFPEVVKLKGHEMMVTCLAGAVVGGEETLVSGGYDNKLRRWVLPGGAQTGEVALPGTASAVCVTEEGAIYAGGADGYLARVG